MLAADAFILLGVFSSVCGVLFVIGCIGWICDKVMLMLGGARQ